MADKSAAKMFFSASFASLRRFDKLPFGRLRASSVAPGEFGSATPSDLS